MKRLFLIGGTMGVGKTTVCQQLKRRLPNSVLLDGDWCWDADPFQVTEETKRMVMDNICHLLNNFLRCSAYETVLFCWVMDRQEIIDCILRQLDTAGWDVKCVSLVAEEGVLRDRLASDIARGLRSPDAMGRSLERMPLYRELHTIKVDTSGRSVQDICGEIERLWGK